MILTTIFGWFWKNIKVVAVIIISIFAAIIFYQGKQIKEKNRQIDRITNNILFYQEQLSDKDKEIRTLNLTIDEFKNTNDSIIQNIVNIQEELKIKDKELKQAQSQNQEINIDTTIVVGDKDFEKEIKPNELTSLIIIKKDSILTAKINIQNTQTLFISNKREYKNQYKNWFRRLIHFDFKKRDVYKYQIHNSNPLIEVKETRLITIDNK